MLSLARFVIASQSRDFPQHVAVKFPGTVSRLSVFWVACASPACRWPSPSCRVVSLRSCRVYWVIAVARSTGAVHWSGPGGRGDSAAGDTERYSVKSWGWQALVSVTLDVARRAVTPPRPPLRTAHGDDPLHSARTERHDPMEKVHDTRPGETGRPHTRLTEGEGSHYSSAERSR